MACDITIINDKIKIDGDESLFDEEGFDTWLRVNLGRIREQLGDSYKLNNFNPTFALDLTERQKRIDEFINAEKAINEYINTSSVSAKNAAVFGGNEAGDIAEAFITYGVTGLFSLVGKSFEEISKPVSEYQDGEEAIREQGNKDNLSQEEIEKRVSDYKRLDALRKIDGTIFGALIQDKFTKSTKDIDALRSNGKFQSDLKKVGLTFDDAITRIKNVGQDTINRIVEQLNHDHPNVKEVRTEFRVVSKYVHPNLLDALNVALGKTEKRINTIDGRLDIVVIDDNGDKTSYDVKLSSIDANEYWPESGAISNRKYNEISAQQMAYYSMLRQWGMRLNKVRIIPAFITYDKAGNITSNIEYRNFRTFNPTNIYKVTCKTYFDYDEEAGAEVVKSSCEDIDELFPGLKLSDKLNTKQYTLEWFARNYKKKINDKYRIPIDERFPLDRHRWNLGVDKKIAFDSWEEAEHFLSEEYIPKMNEIFAQSNIELLNSLNELSKSKISNTAKLDKLRTIAKDISKNNIKTQEFIINTFKKYVYDGWQIIHDETGDFANYGIFIFVKNDIMEIVMLDNNDLFQEYSLGKAGNKLIIGNYRNDLDQGVDDIKYLQAYRGNLLAMQAMALIARNKNGVFTNRIVQAIRTVNLTFRQELTQFNDKLRDNWNDLTFYYAQANPGKPKFRTIGTDQLMSGTLALVNRADDISRLFLDEVVNFKGREAYVETMSDDSSEDILRYIKNLTAHYQINSKEDWAKHTDAFEAFTLLSQALLATRGFVLSMENDCGAYFEGLWVNGLKILSPQESPSTNVRLLGRIESIYEQKLFEEYRKLIFPWQTAVVQALQESNYDDFFSNERDLFKLCFKRDDDGNITEDFVLLNPKKNKDIAGLPKLQALVEIFLDTINRYRIPDDMERARLKEIDDSLYYQVPLTEATFRQQVKNSSNLLQALKTKASNIFTDTKDFLFGDTLSNWELKQYDDISKERIYNYYLDTSEESQELRGKKLAGEAIGFDEKDKHTKSFGVNAFETSLDTIFLRVMAASIRSEVSKEFLPLFTGLRAFIAFNGNVTGANMNSIMDTIDDFIKSNIYHKRIIDPSDTTIYNVLSVLRNITSIVGLSGSTVQFVRENITSWIRTAINATNDPLMKGIFDIDDYSSFMGQIMGDAPKNAKLHSFFAQINYRYRLANMTEQELPGRMKTNRYNINNWAQDVLFLNTTMPDFTHRNAIMCAVLKKRGAFDALYQDENDELKYDPKKDKQYELFFKYKDTKESEIPKQDLDNFKSQKKLYNIAREDWNKRYGLNIKYGEYLPDALSPTEAEAVRTYADHLFGNFDSDKKSLIQKTLLGSFILQFKTFGLQQFMQNVRGKGFTNIIHTRQRTTLDGKKVYIVKSTTREELEEHGPMYFLLEDELEGIPVEKYEPVMDTAGGATYGRLPSTAEAVIDLFTDKEKFNAKMKSTSGDIYKANLYIALLDNLGMMIIAALLRLLYGEDTVKSISTQDWWTRWSYTILMGVAQDGPIDQVLGNLLGNGIPPSIGILQTFFTNAEQVITGEKPVLYGLFNTFGATRQLTGMVLGQD